MVELRTAGRRGRTPPRSDGTGDLVGRAAEPAAVRTERLPAPPGAVVLPLGPRLQERFAPRVRALPAGTRRVLLLAALGGDDVLPPSSSAHVLGLLEPAERAGLVDVDHRRGTVSFRHPRVRATVHRTATSEERRAAHRTLARLVVDRPERRLPHPAAATVSCVAGGSFPASLTLPGERS